MTAIAPTTHGEQARRDADAAADVGLQRAAQVTSAPARRPTRDELAARAERRRPFRPYAAAGLRAHGTDRPATRSET
jgi:3-methyladenine DNA glycosylase/8-oxoguanine DNA glycosylase